MERNDEHVLEGPAPVVASPGQRWAGGILRVFGVLMFLGGALVTMMWLVAAMLEVFMASPLPGPDVLLRIVIMGLAGVLVMVLGSTAGAFGQVMGGSIRMAQGSQFAWWLVASAGRDVFVVLGIGLLLSALFSMIDGPDWVAFGIVFGSGLGFLELAFLAGRWKKRLEVCG